MASCGPANKPNHNTTQSAPGENPLTLQPLASPNAFAVPPGSNDRPLKPGETGTEYMPNGMPALSPRGVNVDAMFAEKMKNSDDRFDRLENAVTDMRREFEAVKPAIVRLVAVEGDMQNLMSQLESLLRNEPPAAGDVNGMPASLMPATTETAAPVEAVESAPAGAAALPLESTDKTDVSASPPPAAKTPVTQAPAAAPPPKAAATPKPTPAPVPAPAPVAKPAPEKPAAALPSVPPGTTAVLALRTGRDGNKTRLVLDVSTKAAYRYDIDNEEHILILELADATWAGAKRGSDSKDPLLSSWSTEPLESGKGTRLILQLKQAVTVAYESTIPASGSSQAPYRIVIDLKEATAP